MNQGQPEIEPGARASQGANRDHARGVGGQREAVETSRGQREDQGAREPQTWPFKRPEP